MTISGFYQRTKYIAFASIALEYGIISLACTEPSGKYQTFTGRPSIEQGFGVNVFKDRPGYPLYQKYSGFAFKFFQRDGSSRIAVSDGSCHVSDITRTLNEARSRKSEIEVRGISLDGVLVGMSGCPQEIAKSY